VIGGQLSICEFRTSAATRLLCGIICNALLDYALRRDDELRQRGEQDRIDDKTVFIIKRH